MMPHHWRPLAHERNSIFKCKQHTCTLHDPCGPEQYDYTMMILSRLRCLLKVQEGWLAPCYDLIINVQHKWHHSFHWLSVSDNSPPQEDYSIHNSILLCCIAVYKRFHIAVTYLTPSISSMYWLMPLWVKDNLTEIFLKVINSLLWPFSTQA